MAQWPDDLRKIYMFACMDTPGEIFELPPSCAAPFPSRSSSGDPAERWQVEQREGMGTENCIQPLHPPHY